MFLATTKDVTLVENQLPAPQRRSAALPVPVRRVATAIAVGAVVQVGMSLAGKYVVRQAAKQALAAPGKVRKGASRRQVANGAGTSVPDDVTALNETVVVHRAWIRR